MQRKGFCRVVACLTLLLCSSQVNAAEWTWNGYFGADYKDTTKEGDPGDFDAFVLSLITHVAVDEKTKIHAQVDWEHAPYFEVANKQVDAGNKDKVNDDRSSGELTLSNAYVEYAVADYLKINAGKFFVPIGFYNQITYVLPAFPTLRLPNNSIYSKGSTPQTDARFFQRYSMGAWLSGTYPVGTGNFSYDIYMSNGRNMITHSDENEHKAIGGRLQFELPISSFEVRPVLSYYSDEFLEQNNSETKQSSIIPGIELTVGDLLVRGEYASSKIDMESADDTDPTSYYAEAHYTFLEKYTPFVRYEHYDPDVDKKDTTDTTIGMAYHIQPWLSQVKLQVRMHEDDTEDYEEYGVGVALGF